MKTGVKRRTKQLCLILTKRKVPVKRSPDSFSRTMPLRTTLFFSFCKQRVDPLQMLILKERENSEVQAAPTRKMKEKNMKLTQ
ncbi:unnamed protein product [Calypogeia fissa]